MLCHYRLVAFILCFGASVTANAALENHYKFDTADSALLDSSGNGRNAFIDDLEVEWVEDDVRGGVMEFGGNTNGFLLAEVPELEGDAFTIMTWAYRDPEFAGGAGGANDGLFQLTLATDDFEFLPPPPNGNKVIGGWVQKADNVVWGRIIDGTGANNNLDKIYPMEDEEWTHFAYRGNGEDFELVVNGDSGEGSVIEYDGNLAEHDAIYIGRQGTETWGGRLDDFRVYSEFLTDEQIQDIMNDVGDPGLLGDFDNNEMLDAPDIDMLTAEVIAGTNSASFDLDNNALVNDEDRRVWVEDLKNSYFGDSNLDGEFNSSDFVAVFTSAKYETGLAAGWGDGDWNGDGVFSSGDFVKAFQGEGYEKGPRPAALVPEPSSMAILAIGLVGLLGFRRR